MSELEAKVVAQEQGVMPVARLNWIFVVGSLGLMLYLFYKDPYGERGGNGGIDGLLSLGTWVLAVFLGRHLCRFLTVRQVIKSHGQLSAGLCWRAYGKMALIACSFMIALPASVAISRGMLQAGAECVGYPFILAMLALVLSADVPVRTLRSIRSGKRAAAQLPVEA